MDKNVKNGKFNFALGFTLAGIVIGAGAALASLWRQKQREQVYHEAEIKAMSELDDLISENETACTACDGIDEHPAPADEQLDIFEADDQPDVSAGQQKPLAEDDKPITQ